MKVKAADGLKVPKEDDPRTYFGAEPENAEPTPYVIRRLATGELVDVADVVDVADGESTAANATKAAKTTTTKASA